MQSRIPSRFRLKRFLGEGATAQVWLAEDTELHRDVAIKIAHHSGTLSPLGFLREARSNSRLKHPHIVRVLEIAAESDWLYLVCEHIDGESLANRLSRESPSPQTCAAWIATLADALAYAHSLGVVHRDIKPQNILIDRNDQVHITDFGLAKDFTDHEATHTQTGRFIGTPAYMSPQQASGQSQASPSDDVYALGIVFYKMLTGEVPFRGNAQSVAFQLMHSEPRAIRESHPDTHKDLEILCIKCIEKRPSDRLHSAAFLRDELRFIRCSRNQSVMPCRRCNPFFRMPHTESTRSCEISRICNQGLSTFSAILTAQQATRNRLPGTGPEAVSEGRGTA